MNLSDNCREFFLDGVTDFYVYPTEGAVLPIPFNVAKIPSMNNCIFPSPLLHVATAGENYVVADNITAKRTMAENSNVTVYKFDISANIERGAENVAEIHKNLTRNDCLVVFRLADNTYRLCYTVPGTFAFSSSVTMTQNDTQCNISIGAQSMSDFIPVTIAD